MTMPAPAPALKSRGDQTRAAVIAAATRRFRDHGFANATAGDIARDANVAEGTVFLHYGSKRGLLLAVMRAYYAELVADLELEADRAAAPRERLHTLLRFFHINQKKMSIIHD